MASTILPQFGGGMNKSMIVVTAVSGSTVTCKKGSTTKSTTEKNGTWTFKGLDLGTWTITVVSGGMTRTKSVPITRLSIEYIDLTDPNISIVKDGTANFTPKARSAGWSSSNVGNSITVSQEDGYVLAVGTKSGYGMVYFEGIDLSGIATLELHGSFKVGEPAVSVLGVWSQLGDYIGDNIVHSTMIGGNAGTYTDVTLDVSSLNGVYIVGITCTGVNQQKIVDLLAIAADS